MTGSVFGAVFGGWSYAFAQRWLGGDKLNLAYFDSARDELNRMAHGAAAGAVAGALSELGWQHATGQEIELGRSPNGWRNRGSIWGPGWHDRIQEKHRVPSIGLAAG